MKKSKVILSVLLCCFAWVARAQQPMETEEANLLPAKTLEVEATFEYQTSADGEESAVPFDFAYGITNRLELAVEPVPYTKISPETVSAADARGWGDIEATLTYNFFVEKKVMPALAFAGEIKIPTARNYLIGTRKTDYTFYLIATKNIGKFENHLNVGYAFVGKPAGLKLNNIFNFAAASEFHMNSKIDLVGEILGNTSSEPQQTGFGTENPVSPEVSGGELVGMLGARYFFNTNFFAALGITYDNNNAVLIRPGLTYFFR